MSAAWHRAHKEEARKAAAEWRKAHPAEARSISQRNSVKLRLKRQNAICKAKMHYGCMNPTCGWKAPHLCCQLDFHHVNADDKVCNVNCNKTTTINAAEANKCIVLCACCHRAVTWGALDVSQLPLCQVDENLTVIG